MPIDHINIDADTKNVDTGTMPADLVVRHPEAFVLTLHDAIFTTASGIPVVVGAFERIDFSMDLKVA